MNTERKKNILKDTKGSSLAEVMVSLVILLMVSVMVIKIFGMSGNLLLKSNDIKEAGDAAAASAADINSSSAASDINMSIKIGESTIDVTVSQYEFGSQDENGNSVILKKIEAGDESE